MVFYLPESFMNLIHNHLYCLVTHQWVPVWIAYRQAIIFLVQGVRFPPAVLEAVIPGSANTVNETLS